MLRALEAPPTISAIAARSLLLFWTLPLNGMGVGDGGNNRLLTLHEQIIFDLIVAGKNVVALRNAALQKSLKAGEKFCTIGQM